MSDRVAEVLGLLSKEIATCLKGIASNEVTPFLMAIEHSERIFLAGAGRSALGMRGFATRLMHLGKPAFVVGETTTPPIGARDLLIIGSGSGRTASLLAAAPRHTNWAPGSF